MRAELREVGVLIDDGRQVVDADFHPLRQEVLLLDGFARVPLRWSLAEQRFVAFECASVPDDFIAEHVAWSPDGAVLALGGRTDSEDLVLLLDATTHAVVDELHHEPRGFIELVAWSPTRPLIVTAHEDTINFWSVDEVPARKRARRPDIVEFGSLASLTPDGRFLIMRGFDVDLRRLDVLTWEEARPPSREGNVASVHAGSRASEVLLVRSGGTVECWDAEKLEVLSTVRFEGGEGPGAFDPTRTLATTTEPVEKQELKLFDAKTGQLLQRVHLRTRGDHSYEAWSRDGRWLLAYGMDTRLFEVVRT